MGFVSRMGHAWMSWRWAVPAAIAAGVVLTTAVVSVWNSASGCSSREDVSARVATLSSDLQQSATAGTMSVTVLAANVRRMNDLATAYETSGDHRRYCDDLDKLRGELAL